MQDGYVIPGRVCVVVETPDGIPPVPGTTQLLTTMHVSIGTIRAIAVFTDDDIADRFVAENKLNNASVITFKSPADFGIFLAAQAKQGASHIAFDPSTASKKPPIVFEIKDIIASIKAIGQKP